MNQRLDQLIRSGVLQEIQDAFSAITGLEARFVDPHNQPLTSPTDCQRLRQRAQVIDQATDCGRQTLIDQPILARIEVDGHLLGALQLSGRRLDALCRPDRHQAHQLARQLGLPDHKVEPLFQALQSLDRNRQAEAIRLAHLMAGAIGRMCAQDIALRQQADRMTRLYRLSTLLAGQHDLEHLLPTVCRSVAQAMNVKAASIRLIDENRRELVPAAVWNLSPQYMAKGPIAIERNPLDSQALAGQIVYVRDMATDERVLYPDDARREGLRSILITGLIYQGRPLGVMRIYTDRVRTFSQDERELLGAIGQLAAGAIENARLDAYRKEAERIERQVRLAADVQRRLMPPNQPRIGPFELAARYEPCFELGGDFYDIIPFEHSLGLVVGDVVGKGVAASLLMATVRAALRAHVQDVYDLDQILARVNRAMCRDTRDNEFATCFYGTIDQHTGRLTYCSAGHEPALLMRHGQLTELNVGGMVIGIDPDQTYDKGLVDLQPGDLLLMYTDGLTEARNFAGQCFGRQRLRQAMLDMAGRPAGDLVNHVLWEVRRFTGLNTATDDITLLAVRYDPGARADTSNV